MDEIHFPLNYSSIYFVKSIFKLVTDKFTLSRTEGGEICSEDDGVCFYLVGKIVYFVLLLGYILLENLLKYLSIKIIAS